MKHGGHLYFVHAKQQLTFPGKITEKRIKTHFKFNEDIFVQIMEILLGEDIILTKHKYSTNIDIVSMVVAWDLEVAKKKT